jgi:hypothetical protein
VLYADVPGYDASLVDVLGIDTLVLSTRSFEPEETEPRPGWRVVLRDQDRVVLQRVDVPSELLRATAAPGVEVTHAEEVGTGARLSVRADHPSIVLLNRLAWPGYTATTADGRPVRVSEGALGLLQLTVPEGSTDIRLSYEIPGLRTGLLAVLVFALVALAHQLHWLRSRRRTAAGSTAQRIFSPRGTLPSHETTATTSRNEPSESST